MRKWLEPPLSPGCGVKRHISDLSYFCPLFEARGVNHKMGMVNDLPAWAVIPPTILALAALVRAYASLVWAKRRDPRDGKP